MAMDANNGLVSFPNEGGADIDVVGPNWGTGSTRTFRILRYAELVGI